MLDAKKIDAAVSAVERFKSRVDRYADAATADANEKVTLYHGTSRENLKKILKQGLKSGNRNYPEHPELYVGERGKSVYLTDEPEEAAEWAIGNDRVVLKVEINKKDPKLKMEAGSGTYVGRVSPKAIKGVGSVITEPGKRRKVSFNDSEEQQESKSRSKETTHNRETRQTKDGEKHIVETKQTSEPQAEDKPDPAAKAQSGESKAAVNALKTKIAQDKKEERYAQRDDAMKPDPNMSAEKMDKMVSTTEKLVSRMDAYDARNRSDDYGHPIATGFRTQEQERRSDAKDNRSKAELLGEAEHAHKSGERAKDRESAQKWFKLAAELKSLAARADDTVTQEEKNIHHTITKHQQDEKEDDEESDAKGGDNPRKDGKKR